MLSKTDQHKLNMEQIISELIQTDKQCKQALNELEKKEENIDNYISEELEKIKESINEKYQYKLNFKKSEYDRKIKEKKEELTNNANIEMQKWEENFLKTKNDTINDIIDNILKKRR